MSWLYQINLTRRCNLRCAHCYIETGVRKAGGTMTREDFLRVIRGIAGHIDGRGRADIHVTGGEPTLLGAGFFADVMPGARAILEGIDHTFTLVTNLLSPDALEIGRHFDRVATAWEPVTRFPTSESEARWRRNLRSLLGTGIEVGVTTAITRPVVELGAQAVLDRLAGEGIKRVHLGFFVPKGDGLANRQDVFPRLEETSAFLIEAARWTFERRDGDPGLRVEPVEGMLAAVAGDGPGSLVCPVVSGAMDIDWDGNTGACVATGGTHDADWLGNVLETSVAEVANSASFRRRAAEACVPKKSCIGCEDYPFCRAGCGVLFRHWEGNGECPGFRRFIRFMREAHAAGVRPRNQDHHRREAC